MAADKNFESHAVEDGTLIEDRTIPPTDTGSTEYSDVLKFSNCKNITVKGCIINGGKEDCIDAVRGENYTFRDTTILPHGSNGITVKGSVDGVVLENLSFDGHGRECDIELGQFDNYWWIGRAPTRNVTIRNVQSVDGKPVILRLWDSTVPVIENSNVKVIRVPKFIWWPYFVFRAAQTRGYKNVAKPVDSSTFIKTK
jgi:hypothetical protein